MPSNFIFRASFTTSNACQKPAVLNSPKPRLTFSASAKVTRKVTQYTIPPLPCVSDGGGAAGVSWVQNTFSSSFTPLRLLPQQAPHTASHSDDGSDTPLPSRDYQSNSFSSNDDQLHAWLEGWNRHGLSIHPTKDVH